MPKRSQRITRSVFFHCFTFFLIVQALPARLIRREGTFFLFSLQKTPAFWRVSFWRETKNYKEEWWFWGSKISPQKGHEVWGLRNTMTLSTGSLSLWLLDFHDFSVARSRFENSIHTPWKKKTPDCQPPVYEGNDISYLYILHVVCSKGSGMDFSWIVNKLVGFSFTTETSKPSSSHALWGSVWMEPLYQPCLMRCLGVHSHWSSPGIWSV